MLRSISRPAITYDLIGLANNGIVAVGRESGSCIRLDSPEVPFLLSRKHATLHFLANGNICLRDLGSTNGTYIARNGQPLRRLQRGVAWILESGDSVGFGGPETIVANDVHVRNPFTFKYYALADEAALSNTSIDADTLQINARNQPMEMQNNTIQQHSDPVDIEVDNALTTAASQGRAHAHCDVRDTIEFRDNFRVPPYSNANCKAVSAAVCAPSDKENHQSPDQTPTTCKLNEILSNHLSCPICQELLVASHTLSCGHMFCGLCLATWLQHKQTCPTCRKPVAGVPVRSFLVDNTITDILGVNIMSPSTRSERKRKQAQWDDIHGIVEQDWALILQQRKQQAVEAAQRHLRSMLGHRASEHGDGNASNPPGAPVVARRGGPLAQQAASTRNLIGHHGGTGPRHGNHI